MKCDFPLELLSGYLDGELDAEKQAIASEHLKGCPACKDTLKELAKLDKYIKIQEIEEPTREFVFGLNRRVIEKVKKKPHFFIFRYAPVLAPVAVALLVFIVVNNVNQHKKLTRTNDQIMYHTTPIEKKLEVQVSESKTPKGIKSKAKTPPKPSLATTQAERAPMASESAAERPNVLASGAVKTEREVSHDELAMPKDKVIGATVDSTVRAQNVALNYTLIPGKTVTLEKRLREQQLTPTIATGQNARLKKGSR